MRPSLRPPPCQQCKYKGYRSVLHSPGSSACEKNANYGKSKAALSRTRIFNVDSGATDHIVGNKGDVKIYIDNLTHPISTANGTIMHATAAGTLSGLSSSCITVSSTEKQHTALELISSDVS
jgi:hypothetical protein